MRNEKRKLIALAVIAGVLAFATWTTVAAAQDTSAEATYQDIQQSMGLVPGFFKLFPESGIAGAWQEMKSVQMNPNTALDNKTKELIGLAVAAQIPCHYCVYFHTAVAKANGATDEEVREAVAMAAITRHWSTVLNGMNVDYAAFKADMDAVLKHAAEMAAAQSSE